MPGMMKKGGAVKKYQEGGLIDRSEAKRRRETSANIVRSVDALPTPRSRMARSLAEASLEDVANQTRRLQQDNEERERTGSARKMKKGGVVKKAKGGMIGKGCK